MALLDKRGVLGFGLGALAVLAVPYVGPIISAVARPLIKSGLKQAILGFEHGREHLAKWAEGLEDIVAEVRTEVQAELAAAQLPVDSGAAASAPVAGSAAVEVSG